MGWIKVSERMPENSCYVIAVRKYHAEGSQPHVIHTFFTKDRELARKNNKYYSRKTQGKDSVHFECAEAGFIVTHWQPLPEPTQD